MTTWLAETRKGAKFSRIDTATVNEIRGRSKSEIVKAGGLHQGHRCWMENELMAPKIQWPDTTDRVKATGKLFRDYGEWERPCRQCMWDIVGWRVVGMGWGVGGRWGTERCREIQKVEGFFRYEGKKWSIYLNQSWKSKTPKNCCKRLGQRFHVA
jgi:hypothetical protein